MLPVIEMQAYRDSFHGYLYYRTSILVSVSLQLCPEMWKTVYRRISYNLRVCCHFAPATILKRKKCDSSLWEEQYPCRNISANEIQIRSHCVSHLHMELRDLQTPSSQRWLGWQVKQGKP